jgi:hypothetical protein
MIRSLPAFFACVVVAYGSSITPSAYTTVNSGGALARRSILTFLGTVACVDNAGTGSTDCTSTALTSINSQTGPAITLAVGTAGTDFAVSPAANTITFNLPSASATARGAVSTGTQTFAGAKTFSSTMTVTTIQSATAVSTQSTLATGSSGTAFTAGFTTSRTHTSSTATVIGTSYTFAPTSGTGNMIAFSAAGSINQTGTATGFAYQFVSSPSSFTSVYDFRAFHSQPATVNLISTAPDQQIMFLGGMTYASGAAKTVTNIATLRIDAPIAGTNVTITNPYALWVDTGNAQFDGTTTSNLYTRVPPVAIGALQACAAGSAGARATVNDALAPAALAVVAAGGAVTVGVLCDGANWIVQ